MVTSPLTAWPRLAVLAALMLAASTFNTAENLPVGLLELISESLRVSLSVVGLPVTGYGATVAVTSVPLARVVSTVPRRHVLTGLLTARTYPVWPRRWPTPTGRSSWHGC